MMEDPHSVSSRVINFSAGPSSLPVPVLERARRELLNWDGCGLGVMEMSHRGSDFKEIINSTEANLRKLLQVPDNFRILFTQGGGTGQFAAVPLNFLSKFSDQAAYLVTGVWSEKAYNEAVNLGFNIQLLFDGRVTSSGKKFDRYRTAFDLDAWAECLKTVPTTCKYIYYCSNETVNGVEFSLPTIPKSTHPNTFYVCDMSSNFLSRPIDFSQHGFIFAAAQKNAGIAGSVILIVRDDLFELPPNPYLPTCLNYEVLHQGGSIANTPPTFPIYMGNLVVEWLLGLGGIKVIEGENFAKSQAFYKFIDNSNGYYVNSVDIRFRSRMNIPVRITDEGNPRLEKLFVSEAKNQDMIYLSGHQTVGALRVSMYNSISIEQINRLIRFMVEFQASHPISTD